MDKSMKKMPYVVEEGAIERAKYRAKMSVREVANPTAKSPIRIEWRWAVAIAAVVVMGVVGLVGYFSGVFKPMSPMEELIAEMKKAPDEVIKEWSADATYFYDDANAL